MALRVPMTLELDTGDVWEVVGDQRDWETAEQVLSRKGIAPDSAPITFQRCMGWAAARRVGKTTASWWDFTGQLVDVDAQEPEPVDPTQPVT